ANYYFTQGNPSAARQRLELVLKRYARTLVIPETLYLLAEVNFYEGKNPEAVDLLRQLSSEYGYTEWGRRAVQRLRAQRRGEERPRARRRRPALRHADPPHARDARGDGPRRGRGRRVGGGSDGQAPGGDRRRTAGQGGRPLRRVGHDGQPRLRREPHARGPGSRPRPRLAHLQLRGRRRRGHRLRADAPGEDGARVPRARAGARGAAAGQHPRPPDGARRAREHA